MGFDHSKPWDREAGEARPMCEMQGTLGEEGVGEGPTGWSAFTSALNYFAEIDGHLDTNVRRRCRLCLLSCDATCVGPADTLLIMGDLEAWALLRRMPPPPLVRRTPTGVGSSCSRSRSTAATMTSFSGRSPSLVRSHRVNEKRCCVASPVRLVLWQMGLLDLVVCGDDRL